MPTPLTPTTSTTLGLVSVCSGSSGSISSVTISQRFCRSSAESMLLCLMRSPSLEQIFPAVVTPTSARMRISSSSSSVSAVIFPEKLSSSRLKFCLVFFTLLRKISKNPMGTP